MKDSRDEGCLCQGCLKRYKVDLWVPTPLWRKIRRRAETLLCGECIMSRIEALGEFNYFRLVKPR